MLPGRPEVAEVAEVVYAVEHPIGTPRLRVIVKPGEKVVIITSDVTGSVHTSVRPPAN
jgi:nickel-dependent lactate racemase